MGFCAKKIIPVGLLLISIVGQAAPKDYYEILGLARTATEDEVKGAYRKLAMKYHPDRHMELSEDARAALAEKFKIVGKAYDMLRDPYRRSMYDSSEDHRPQFYAADAPRDTRSSDQIRRDVFADTFYFDRATEEIVDRYTQLRFSRKGSQWITQDLKYEFLNIIDRGLIRNTSTKLVFIPGISKHHHWNLNEDIAWFPGFLWDATIERHRRFLGEPCEILLEFEGSESAGS